MGICESNLNTKGLENEYAKKHSNKNLNDSKIIPLKKGTKNSQYSENISGKLSTSIEKDDIIKNSNKHPLLEKYEPSLAKTSELENTNFDKSEVISKSNGVEIIIRGQINSNCFNKENDFDNDSFMKLVKNNGGKILKDDIKDKKDSNCKKENKILYDFEKDDISEIKSQSSLGEISNSKNTLLYELNGIDMNNDIRSEISKGNFTNYSLTHKQLNLDRNNKFDKRSQYTTKTIRQQINANKYLNGIFSNKYNTQNGYNNNIPKKPYNTQTFKPNKDLNINNKCKYQSSSNKTNSTITEKLTDSYISSSKNNEKNQNMVNNGDIIKNISPF